MPYVLTVQGSRAAFTQDAVTPLAPPFDVALVAAMGPMAERTGPRPRLSPVLQEHRWQFVVFSVSAFDPALVASVAAMAARPPSRASLYPSTTFQDGWLFSVPTPPPFTVALTAAMGSMAERTRSRPAAIFPYLEHRWQSGVFVDPSLQPALEPMFGRFWSSARPYPSTGLQDGWIFSVPPPTPFDARLYPPNLAMSGMVARRQGLYPSTSFQDGWLFSVPTPTFNVAFVAGMGPMAERSRPSPKIGPVLQEHRWQFVLFTPSFDAALYPPNISMTSMTLKRVALYPSTLFQDGWTLGSQFLANRYPPNIPLAERMRTRQRLYPSTEFDKGPIFSGLFPANLYPPNLAMTGMTGLRQRLYPSTAFQDGWLFKNLTPPFDVTLWPALEVFAAMMRERLGLFPSTEQDRGPIFSGLFNPALYPPNLPMDLRTRQRPNLTPHISPQDGWLFSGLFNPALYPAMLAMLGMTGRPPRPFPSTAPSDAWQFTANLIGWTPVFIPFSTLSTRGRLLVQPIPYQDGWLFSSTTPVFDPALFAALVQMGVRPPARLGLFPSTMTQDGWIFTAIPPPPPPPVGGAHRQWASWMRRWYLLDMRN